MEQKIIVLTQEQYNSVIETLELIGAKHVYACLSSLKQRWEDDTKCHFGDDSHLPPMECPELNGLNIHHVNCLNDKLIAELKAIRPYSLYNNLDKRISHLTALVRIWVVTTAFYVRKTAHATRSKLDNLGVAPVARNIAIDRVVKTTITRCVKSLPHHFLQSFFKDQIKAVAASIQTLEGFNSRWSDLHLTFNCGTSSKFNASNNKRGLNKEIIEMRWVLADCIVELAYEYITRPSRCNISALISLYVKELNLEDMAAVNEHHVALKTIVQDSLGCGEVLNDRLKRYQNVLR